MEYKFSYRPYQREFKQPLITSHGIWQFREGIIINIENNLSEIAPIPWFGSETIDQALEFCQNLNYHISEKIITEIPDNLPSCQFAFSSALYSLKTKHQRKIKPIKYCYLLPTGANILQVNFKQLNYETFKWKIGVNHIDEEIKLLKKLIKLLPKNSKLRLDANGGLNLNEAKQWLNFIDGLSSSPATKNMIEFVEQPLAPENLKEMLTLSDEYQTTLALDESIANLQQLNHCYQKGWRGVFVIKAGIIGSIFKLQDFLLHHQIDVVFSSVLETKIGADIALAIASEFSQRAAGYGVSHWFKQNDSNWLDKLW